MMPYPKDYNPADHTIEGQERRIAAMPHGPERDALQSLLNLQIKLEVSTDAERQDIWRDILGPDFPVKII